MDRFKKSVIGLSVFFILFITGCKVELYSNLNEKDANEMLAILLNAGIDTDKVTGKEKTWGLRVEKGNIARAVGILKESGYPRDQFVTMGEVFKKEGLVSSPLEERVRFIFALSQEISSTLSNIDGVIVARTQIVLPENNPLSDNLLPSSASVFIKHRPDHDLEASISKIKKLVVNSIEGLTYEKVTVVLFPASHNYQGLKKQEYTSVLGISISKDSYAKYRILIVTLLIAVGILLMCAVYLIWGRKTKK